jgi:hypothetical protein
MVLIVYSCTLALGAARAVHEREQLISDSSRPQHVKVTLDDQAPVKADDLVFLGANSSYYFFFDRASKAGTVLLKEHVKVVRHLEKK